METGLQPQKAKPEFHATFAADLAAIDPVVEGVMEAAKSSEATLGRELEIETSLREALANAIIHGCGKDPTKNVHCTAEERNGEFTITVIDPGGRLDLAKIPDPTRQENLALGHGRGVHMMNVFMDQVQVTVDKGRKTEVRMTVRKRPAGE
jgi:anti-sigma regulatory factor (Ser/Thr protein kinase)